MKTIKRMFLAIIMIHISIGLAAQADDTEERREAMEKIKQEYIMERMELNDAQKEKLMAIQAEYHLKTLALRKEHSSGARKMKMEMKEKMETEGELSEEESRIALTKRLESEEQRIQLEKKYTNDMIAAISAKKTLEYKKLEREFKRDLLEMLKDDKVKHHMKRELKHEKHMERPMKTGKSE